MHPFGAGWPTCGIRPAPIPREEPGARANGRAMAEEESDTWPLQVSNRPVASPLEFTVHVTEPNELELDTVVETWRSVEGYGQVAHVGVVESIRVGNYYRATVRVVRIFPENVYLPPIPGYQVKLSSQRNVNWAMRFETMDRKIPIGVMGNGMPAFANLDFLSGVKGAHINIAGISGVATKTSYALFLLYSLFQSSEGKKSRAILFNAKGDDLLYLDKPNARISAEAQEVYKKLGLPCQPFQQVAYHGVSRPLWTLREFAQREFMRYLLADTEQTGVMEFGVDRLVENLREAAAASEGPGLLVGGKTVSDLAALVTFLVAESLLPESKWFENVTTPTRRALARRLSAIGPQVTGLIGEDGSFDPFGTQLNVVDIHRLSDRARVFVLGAVLKTLFVARESTPDGFLTTYLMVDELNKYAPREGGDAIRDMLLDVAERGRSLGIVLVGAEQTASQVEDRVVGNAALRVVGRMESAEAQREQSSWLSETLRRRATLLQPGTMIVSQPEVPVPLVVTFPFPAWATRRSEVATTEKASVKFGPDWLETVIIHGEGPRRRGSARRSP